MNTHPRDIERPRTARLIELSGRVQGVGFRPFVYRIAHEFGLLGRVRNGSGRVLIHVEGWAGDIMSFERALLRDKPPLARPRIEVSREVPIEGAADFRIEPSEAAETPDIHLPPDLFCCDDCLAEMQSPGERRYRYPFTNCTQCGPRYTIIEALPYDRPNTSMAGFDFCADCRAEYGNPRDRRFHAQPLACPACGPKLSFAGTGHRHAEGEAALAAAIAVLRDGGIVGVKGVGGYHLTCDPANDAAVRRLRERKHRPDKPLAVMFPQEGADGVDAVRRCVVLDEAEVRACADPARPIVLARRREDCGLSVALAPGLGELGVFLPYSPLHHLLLSDFGRPLVATSGNVSGEPVITDNGEAMLRLAGVADAFLHHDRPIVRPADDSVVRVIGGVPRPIRIGRGFAPLELDLPIGFPEPVLAVGGHMKGAIALGWGNRAVVSPHIGELDSPRSLKVFAQVIAGLQALYGVEARRVVCDAHPDYASTRWAVSQAMPVVRIQHHAAHASAIAGEHPEIDRWLVLAWDGVGLGADGDLWGGEALVGSPGAWRRAGSIRPFRVTGADRVGREPWRSSAGLMWETGRDFTPSVDGATLARQAWEKGIGTARTSSVGRLFDAAASLVLGVDCTSFEGQGPMMLEGVASPSTEAVSLPLDRRDDGILRIDWEPLLNVLCDDALPPGLRAGMFHESLARAAVEQVSALGAAQAFNAVGLAGGVFQNRRLAERILTLLGEEGIQAFLPETVPANDGGLAFGQLIETLHGSSEGAHA